MIDQRKVREMTRMSILEEGPGKKELKISSYRRVDYVLLQLVGGFVMGTICFAAVFLLWFLWKWDGLNQFFANGDFEGFFWQTLIYYGAFMLVYLVVCGVVAARRHRLCRRRRDDYLRHLHRLCKYYASEGAGEED